MALMHEKPNSALMQELELVSRGAGELSQVLESSNFLPDDFPITEIKDLMRTLEALPNGTAEGCRIPLDYVRLRLTEIGRQYFRPEGNERSGEIFEEAPTLARGMALDQAFRQLLHQISYAQAEYRHQAEDIDNEDAIEIPVEPDASIADEIGTLSAEAQELGEAFKELGTSIEHNTNPNSDRVDRLRRQSRDVEVHARLANNELRRPIIRPNRFNKIISVLLRMPEIIENTGKAITIGVDVLEPFADQWLQFWVDVQTLSLNNLRRFGQNLQKASRRLKGHVASSRIRSTPRRELLAVFRDLDELWCPELVAVPSGKFLMGSPSDEADRNDNEDSLHEVTFDGSIAVGRFPVTFKEYDYYCCEAGIDQIRDWGWGRGTHPVVSVSWDSAQAYCEWLRAKTGHAYRLPTEAEWEYACRAGTETAFAFGDKLTTDQANFGSQKTKKVGSYPANEWGLYDMHGNVWEWVEDCWNDTYLGAPIDGSAWTDGDCGRRMLRGGSWNSGEPSYLRSACRVGFRPDVKINFNGFRVVRTL